jgi:hypothetical protein
MRDSGYRWWGFRLRNPMEFEYPHVTRVEIYVYNAFLFLPLMLGLYIARQFPVSFLDLQFEIYCTIALFCLPMIAGLFLPKSLAERLPWMFWFLLARERGAIIYWDLFTLAAFVATIVFVLLKSLPTPSPSLISMLVTAAAAGFLLIFFQRSPGLSSRFHAKPLPKWLDIVEPRTEEQDNGPKDQLEDTIGPDPDASPIYRYELKGKLSSVGIQILDDTLGALRKLNAAANGFLYCEEPASVVLVDRGPAKDIGRKELIRFSRQIFHHNNEHKLTDLQKANAVLNFVQQRFEYRYDKDSTKDFPGGAFEEYGRFALETIHDQHGDCDCTSILCASLLAYLGYDVALLLMQMADPDTGEESGHCAVGLSAANMALADNAAQLDCFKAEDGSYYLYGETACTTKMSFGLIPEGFKKEIVPNSQKVVKIPQLSSLL